MSSPLVVVQPAKKNYYNKNRTKYYKAWKRETNRRKKWPSKKYGTAHIERGQPMGQAMFGIDLAAAKAAELAGDPTQMNNRRATGFYGRGDYKDVLKYVSRIGGAMAGGAYGMLTHQNPLYTGKQGWDHGANFSQMMGWGDYGMPVSNQIIQGSQFNTPLRVNVDPNNLQGDVYLEHREFLQNIFTAGGTISPFRVDSFDINAGLSTTFPWLSQVAQNFTLYEFIGLIFEFRPTTGESGGSTNQLGKLIMATQYDPDADDFNNSIEMENYDYSASAKPAVGMVHGVETMPSQQFASMLYVRTGASTKSKIFTDLGKFQIATEGIPNPGGVASPVGELWVTYKIKLSRSRLYTTLNNDSYSSYYLLNADATRCTGTPVAVPSLTPASYIPVSRGVDTYLASIENNIDMTVNSTANNTFSISFPLNVRFNCFYIIVAISQPANKQNNIDSQTLFNCNLLTKFINPGGMVGNTAGRLRWTSPGTGTDLGCVLAVKVDRTNTNGTASIVWTTLNAFDPNTKILISVQGINMEDNE